MFNSYLVVSLFPRSYHKLMVAKCCNKWEKFQEAKWRSTVEWRLVRELERTMDLDLFQEIQSNWAKDSPHHLVILHKMFHHAASKGQKEAEQIICWGHQQHMPQLDPEAGMPALKLTGPETSREELLEIYLKVYKLQASCREGMRLLKPGSNLVLEIPIDPGAESPAGNEKAW